MKRLLIILLSLSLVLGNVSTSLASTKTETWTYLGKFKITCYCSCSKCCGTGKNAGKITASGTTPTRFRTAAAPKNIPFNTKLYIDTFGPRIVEDRGGAVKHNHIDIYTNSHEVAASYAVQYQDVWMIEEK